MTKPTVTPLTKHERSEIWTSAISAGARYDGPEGNHQIYRDVEQLLAKRQIFTTDQPGIRLFDAVAELAHHWRYPTGDFRYNLPEMAQVLRQMLNRVADVDVFDSAQWNPRGAEPIAHHVAFVQPIATQSSQWVCTCGHVDDSFGFTVAERFGQHLREQLALDPTGADR